MNKLLMILFVFSYVHHLWAKPSKKYIVCLGQEETYIHKNKMTGAYSKLNQDIISAVVQLGDRIILISEFEENACAKKFTSLEILRYLITKKKEVFVTTANPENILDSSIDANAIKELHDQSLTIFLDFITSIQALMKSSKCLVKQIPEIKNLFDKIRYSAEDVGIEQIIDEVKDINRIFDKLQDLSFNNKC